MNKYRKKRLIAMRLCSIVLLTLFVAASARAQTLPTTAPATDDRSDTTSVLSCVSRFRLSFAPSGLRPMPANSARTNVDKGVTKEFDKAWRISGDGTNGREGVVLIFRMEDGSYTGKLQGFTNEYRKSTFKWNPTVLAIVHTHPNSCDPRPSPQDERVAEKYDVPIFTITLSGMYVYNPTTRMTSKVVNGLDWLKLSKWQETDAKLKGSGLKVMKLVTKAGGEAALLDEPKILRSDGEEC